MVICQDVFRKTKELSLNLEEDEKCYVWTSVLRYYTENSYMTFLQTS